MTRDISEEDAAALALLDQADHVRRDLPIGVNIPPQKVLDAQRKIFEQNIRRDRLAHFMSALCRSMVMKESDTPDSFARRVRIVAEAMLAEVER